MKQNEQATKAEGQKNDRARSSRQKRGGAKPKAQVEREIAMAERIRAFVERYNERELSRARNAYVDGDVHTEFVIASDFLIAAVADTAKALDKGEVPAHLDISCCADTFAAILTNFPAANYFGLCLRDPIVNLPDEKLFAKYDESKDLDRLAEALKKGGFCADSPYRSNFPADEAAQKAYYKAIVALVEQLIGIAHANGSSSVRGFVEALRLLQPLTDNFSYALPLAVQRADALAAYDALLKAHADLWNDLYLAKLGA